VQLPLGENRLQVVVHRVHPDLKKLRQERLRQPYRFVFKPALDARAAILVNGAAGVRGEGNPGAAPMTRMRLAFGTYSVCSLTLPLPHRERKHASQGKLCSSQMFHRATHTKQRRLSILNLYSPKTARVFASVSCR
jgi:hypothetical protein